MLNDRIRAHVESELRSGESITVTMVGFRPLSRSWALVAIFVSVFAGFAISTAADIPSWIGGGVGGGVGAAAMMLLDQRRARAEHEGKGMSVGLAVTTQRLFLLELDTGIFSASISGPGLVVDRSDIVSLETERMQGSGLKRPGVLIEMRGGRHERVIPARIQPFRRALGF